MTATEGETKDQTLTIPPNSTDDEDTTFNFFYDIVKQLILKRNDVGGKLYYINTLINVFISYNNIGISFISYFSYQ